MIGVSDSNLTLLLFNSIFFYFVYFIMIVLHLPQAIGLSRVFANDPGDRGSIPGRVISKTQKMVLDAALLNIQQYKVKDQGWSGVIQGMKQRPPLHLSIVAI